MYRKYRFVGVLAIATTLGLVLTSTATEDPKCCLGYGAIEDCSGCQKVTSLWINVGDNDYDKCTDSALQGLTCTDVLGNCYYLPEGVMYNGWTTKEKCVAAVGVPDAYVLGEHGKNNMKCTEPPCD